MNDDEKAQQAICLVFLLACLALAVCFAQVCRQRDERTAGHKMRYTGRMP